MTADTPSCTILLHPFEVQLPNFILACQRNTVTCGEKCRFFEALSSMDCVPCNHEGDGGPRMLSKLLERRRRTAAMTIAIKERKTASKRGSMMTRAGDLGQHLTSIPQNARAPFVYGATLRMTRWF